MKKTINGTDFKTMLFNAGVIVEQNKQDLNDLNVFPVPDGDTGTNMSMTINYALRDIENFDAERLSKMAERIKQGLIRGSHGNSGTIMSLLFNGISKGFENCEIADAGEFALALKTGVDKAYSVVYKPAEGTILTVARKAAERALELSETVSDIGELLSGTIEAAYAALALTPTQNPVLAKAGVVDAGGKGYCHILEGMLAGARGERLSPVRAAEAPPAGRAAPANVFAVYETGDITFGYCTEFIVLRENTDRNPESLRSFLASLGDSLVFVDDGGIIKVHVHTNHPGRALEAAVKYGSLTSIKIENMREQHSHQLESSGAAAQTATPEPEIAPPDNRYGFVSVAAGAGIKNVFGDLGVDNVVEGGQTMNPSTEDILKSVNKTPAEIVFVLPNNKNIIMTAEQTASLTEKRVIVIPTRSIPEGIAALLAFDPETEPEDNESAMRAAVKNVRTGSVTYAARDSVFDGTEIARGDYLALSGGKLGYNGKDFVKLAHHLAAALSLERAEFVTVFTGEGTSPENTDTLVAELKNVAPSGAEFNIIDGGQPVYYYIIGVE